MPNYAAVATLVVTNDGFWSELVNPSSNDVVWIKEGADVIYDVVSTNTFKALVIHGSLEFEPDDNTWLTVGTIMVESNGLLRIAPYTRDYQAVVSFSGSLNTNEDPAQLSIGLFSNGGVIEIEGPPVASGITTTPWAGAGSNTVSVASVDGWRVDDILVFPDQQIVLQNGPAYWNFHYTNQTEFRTITGLNGNSVSLSSALTHTHGETWVGNITRNVQFQKTAGTPRPHMMFAGHVSATVRNAVFTDFGRTRTDERHDTKFNTNGVPTQIGTNQRGRYVLHAHHAHEQVNFEGNAILGALTPWGSDRLAIVIHNSRGLVRSNIVIAARGSGIFLEDGFEMGEVSGNLVIGAGGGTGLGDDARFGILNGEDLGAGGFGIWLRGPLAHIRNNVVVGFCNQAAYAYFTHLNFVSGTVPDIPGNPPNLIGQYISVSATPIQAYGSFDGNVAKGLFKHGVELNYQQVESGTILTNSTIYLNNGDGINLQTIHCQQVILDNCALIAVGATGTGAYNNNGSEAKLTVNGGAICNLYVGAWAFPKGGKFNGVLLVNTWNVVMWPGMTGNGLTDLIGYAGGNWRLYTNAQAGSVTLPNIYGHAVEIQ